jgi:hypothetical protein
MTACMSGKEHHERVDLTGLEHGDWANDRNLGRNEDENFTAFLPTNMNRGPDARNYKCRFLQFSREKIT